jgi:hypothetical protein
MTLRPILKAMLLCDSTLVEEGTRKRTLIGLFDRVHAQQFPSTHPAMSVYVQFREIQGTFDFTLELYDLNEGRAMNRAVISKYEVSDRSRDSELVFNLMSVRFEHPGDYEFRIFVDDLVFGQKQFRLSGS